jgi:hypothetical protein
MVRVEDRLTADVDDRDADMAMTYPPCGYRPEPSRQKVQGEILQPVPRQLH